MKTPYQLFSSRVVNTCHTSLEVHVRYIADVQKSTTQP